MNNESRFNQEFREKRRPLYIEMQKTTFEAFIESIEIAEAYQENEYLAIKVIELLKQKYNLIF